MKHFGKILTLGAALLAGPLAHATPIQATINVQGGDSFTATTISFPSGFQSVGLGSTLNGTTIPYLTPISFTTGTITFSPVPNLGTGVLLASLPTSGLQFYVVTETPTYVANNGSNASTLDLKGTGYFLLNGGNQTAATFDLTTQEAIGGTSATLTSFSASSMTVAATPEPSSLIMLGTGLVSAAGMLVRRRRIV